MPVKISFCTEIDFSVTVHLGRHSLSGGAVANIAPSAGMYSRKDLDAMAASDDSEEGLAWKHLRARPAVLRALDKVLYGKFTITVDDEGNVSVALKGR